MPVVTSSNAARWGAIASWGCLVLVFVLDAAISPGTAVLTVMYGFAPLIACAVLPPTATGAVAIAAVAGGMVSGFWNNATDTPQHVLRMVDLVLLGAAAVVISHIRVRREAQIARLAVIAEVAQGAILPSLPHRAGPVRVAARYVSAAEDARVGGDLYDCYRRCTDDPANPGRLRFIVGDVRGKGIAGVEHAARVIRAFRQSAAIEPTLASVAQDMDRYLHGFFNDEEFVTAILVDASSPHTITIVSCGHPPALLRRSADGHLWLLPAPTGLPLGTGIANEATYQEITVPWAPGDRLLLYTDGLSEARNSSGTFLSPLALGPALKEPDLPDAIDAVLGVRTRHAPNTNQADDLALLLLEHLHTAEPAPHDTND